MRHFFYLLCLLALPLWAQKEEPLIILDEDEENPSKESPSGASIWRFNSDFDFKTYYQHLLAQEERPLRALGSVWFDAGLLPDSFWEMRLSAFGRVGMDYGFSPKSGKQRPVVPIFVPQLYDSYLRLSGDYLSLWVGNLVVPWGAMQVVRLADRLNPFDNRRGPQYPDALMGRLPQPGVRLKGALDHVNLEAIFWLHHFSPHFNESIFNTSGFQVGRYQTALAHKNLALAKAWDPALASWQAAMRLQANLESVDLAFSLAGVMDDVPSLEVHDARAFFHYKRALSFAAELTWVLDPVLLHAEALYQPLIAGKGKTTLLRQGAVLKTAELHYAGAALGVEASYGEFLKANFEVFDLMWFGVPNSTVLEAIEPLSSARNYKRFVHRLGLGLDLRGRLWEERFEWICKGEIGVWRADISSHLEFRYRASPDLFSLGVFGDLFAGLSGSPGDFRRGLMAFGADLKVEL